MSRVMMMYFVNWNESIAGLGTNTGLPKMPTFQIVHMRVFFVERKG